MKAHKVSSARREQLDRVLLKLSSKIPRPPKEGWIHELRTALIMSSTQLAKRLKVTPSVIASLEKSERGRTITLKSLDRVAEALDCEVRYVLVPRKPLSKLLFERAQRVIEREERSIEGSMRLEGQGRHSKFEKKVNTTIDAALLIINKDKRLWED